MGPSPFPGPRADRTFLIAHGRRPLPPVLHGLARFALDVLAAQGVAFVVSLLSPGEADLELHAPLLEVGAQRHDREALLARPSPQPEDLALVEEELAVALLGVVLDVRMGVGADAAGQQGVAPPPRHPRGGR